MTATPATPWFNPSKAAILIFLAGLLAYQNCFTKVFVLDDLGWIASNTDLDDPLDYLNINSGRFVAELTILFSHWTGGTVVSYHLFNVAVHLVAALVLFGLIRRTMLLPCWQGRFAEQAALQFAFVVSLLWVVHPLTTASVTYIIQRMESLMGLFYLLTLYSFVRSTTASRPWLWLVGAWCACILGMGTKQVMASAPVAVLLYDGILVSRSYWAALKSRWLFYGLLFPTMIWPLWPVFLTQGEVCESAGLGTAIRPFHYALTQCQVLFHYLKLTFWPTSLCLDYLDWPLVTDWRQVVVQGVLILLALAVTFWALWRRSWTGFVAIWFFLILGPTSSFFPIIDMTFDHRMYLSLITPLLFAVALGWLALGWLAATTAKTIAAGSIVGAAVLALIVLTFQRNEDYVSGANLWMDVVEKRPHCVRGHVNVGRFSILENPELSWEHLNIGLDRQPNNWFARPAYAAWLWRYGTLPEAVSAIQFLDSETERTGDSDRLAGLIHWANGNLSKAEHFFDLSLQDDSMIAKGYFLLAAVRHEQGKTETIAKLLTKGHELDAHYPRKAAREAHSLMFDDPVRRKNALTEGILIAKAANLASRFQDPSIQRLLDTALAKQKLRANPPEP